MKQINSSSGYPTCAHRRAVALAPLAAALVALPAWAEDIDLYAGTSSASGAPNVLFVVDNSSNWSASSNQWSYSTNKNDGVYDKCSTTAGYSATDVAACKSYVNQIFFGLTTTTKQSGNATLYQGQIEMRALKLVLNEAYCNQTDTTKQLAFNAGMLLLNDQGTADISNSLSGYVRHALRPMSAQQCTTLANVPAGSDLTQYLVADLDNIDAKVQNTFKGPSSNDYGSMLYEAFKYFGGWTNPAGAPGGTTGGATGVAGTPTGATGFGPVRYSSLNVLEDPNAFVPGTNKSTYQSPIGNNSCGNNYIIFIGNTWPNQEFGTNQQANPPTNTLMTRLGYRPSQIYKVSQSSMIRFADEWAQFLYTTDVSDAPSKQNVRMFTIDVYNAQQNTDQSKLLQSMADAGQGTTDHSGYFAVGGNLYTLIKALKDALTQIAAVNSVFASPALPASVNAQGIYLNQVFMGAFRPDGEARQRWPGNLKQYKFKANSDRSLTLVDANNNPAIDSAQSGFLLNCATSFWTSDSGTYWQYVNGTASACSTSTNSLYSDSPDGPIVERGGAGQVLRNAGYAARNIQTCTNSTCSGTPTLSALTSVTLSVTGLPSGVDNAMFRDWVTGKNTGDYDPNASTGALAATTYPDPSGTSPTTRPTVHGEVVHSTPLAVNYGTSSVNDVVVFYGAGDGMLHAVNGSQTGTGAGSELWAFIAPEHYQPLVRVMTNSPLISYPSVSSTITPTPQPKIYFFDGSIGGYQENTSSGSVSKLWIYPTMRRGGNMVYAFDVTSKPSASSEPSLLWRFGCATPGANCATGASGESNMGQSWSTPVPIRIPGTSAPLIVFGAGYDKCEDNDDPDTACSGVAYGRGIYVLDAQNGASANYRYFGLDSTAGRFVADIVPVDMNGDGYIDVLYALDTRGNIWRINTSNPASGFQGYANGVADWPTPVKVATVSQWGLLSLSSERRKFLNAASVVVLGTKTLVLAGTGDREKPSATSTAASVNNRFYAIRDDVTVTSSVTAVNGYNTLLGDPSDLLNVTGLTSVSQSQLAAKKGWFLNLLSTNPYEQVVTTPLTLAGVTYFSTYQAKPTDGSNQCSNLGTGRSYRVDFETGVEKPNSSGDLAPELFLSQGIPPSPVGGLVSVDGTVYPFCIGCTGPSVLTPTNPAIPVRPNRRPVYRYQQIDK